MGKVLAAVFVAEIGDISRFDSPKKLCSWAGLTPKHKESDEVVHRGSITKQGSGLVRWAAIEAVGNYRAKGNEKLRADYRRIAERRGKYKARVAVARSSSPSCSTRCETEKSDASPLRPQRDSRPRTDASPTNAVAHRHWCGRRS